MESQRKYIKKVIVLGEQSTPEARADRLRRVRNMANLKREHMCDDGQMNINTYKGWEIARYGGLPVDGAERVIARVAEEGVVCNLDWLLYGIGMGPHIVATIQTSSVEGSIQDQLIKNEIELFRKQYGDILDYKIEDDGLSPLYLPGDYVAGIKCQGKKIQALVGRNCIVQTATGVLLARHIKQGSSPERFMLCCTHTDTRVKNPVCYDVSLMSAAAVLRHYSYKPWVNKKQSE